MPSIAFRAVRSRRKFSKSREIMRQIERHVDTVVKKRFIGEFEKRVANWEHKVGFSARKFITPESISLNVFPTGKNKKYWEWNTLGTKPHTIRPKRAKTLAFMWGGLGSYRPKTKPIGKYGGPGVISGGKMHFAPVVNHPGTDARQHEKAIKEENKDWFNRSMENAWRRAIRSV